MITHQHFEENDPQLVSRAAKGDFSAVYTLLTKTYHKYLCGVIKKFLPKSSDDTIEEIIHSFNSYLITPSQEGKYRLRNLSGQQNVKVYLGRALNNFLNDNIDTFKVTDGESLPPIVNVVDEEAEEDNTNAEISSLLEALWIINTKEFEKFFDARSRYILLSYLVTKRYEHEGRPLKMSEKLSQQLGEPASTIYNSYKRSMDRLIGISRKILNDKYGL